MQLQFFCPLWGMEQDPRERVFSRIRNAGYDGIEMSIPLHGDERAEVSQLLEKYDLLLIAQHYESTGNTREVYEEDYEKYLLNAAQLRPLLINSQTGRDYFSFDDNMALIKKADQIARQTGVRIIHETHRGKFSFSSHSCRPYFRRLPELRITADFSHWCNVSESLLQDQPESMDEAIQRSDHIHARVGHSQAPQVTDPRAPEWKIAFEAHLVWWDRIVAMHLEKNTRVLTITPEFGPFPYMPSLAYTQRPVADQWEINLFMKDFLTERYKNNLSIRQDS